MPDANDIFREIQDRITGLGQGAFSSNGRSNYGVPINAFSSRIYLGPGEEKVPELGPGPYAPGYKPEAIPFSYQDKELSYGEARIMPRDWDEKTLKEFVNKGILNKIPGFGVDMGMPEILSAWDEMVKTSYELNQGDPKKKWTPWDVLNSYSDQAGKFGTERKGEWVYDIATGKPVKYVGPTSKTRTSRNVNLTSPEDVRALALQAMREALGRAPTTEEVAQFRSAINAMETASPEVTSTTVQLKPNLETGTVEEVSSSSTTSGGVSQAAMEGVISQAAESGPEYGKYQAGTTYFNALMGMMGGG